jgi:hypothetical protein
MQRRSPTLNSRIVLTPDAGEDTAPKDHLFSQPQSNSFVALSIHFSHRISLHFRDCRSLRRIIADPFPGQIAAGDDGRPMNGKNAVIEK